MYRLQAIACDVTHRAGFTYHLPKGQDAWLLILTHTPAVFTLEGARETYPSGCLVRYRPGQPVFHGSSGDAFRNDWVRYTVDEEAPADALFPCGMPLVVPSPGYYHKLFQLLSAEAEGNGFHKVAMIDMLMQVMLQKLEEAFDTKPVTHTSQGVYALKKEIYRRPQARWSVKRMGEMLSVSTGHLESIYKRTFGVSCMEDVILSRVALAKKYLQSSEYSIAEIIPLCGYRSPEHFYRQFKKVTSMTPCAYRKAAQANHRSTCTKNNNEIDQKGEESVIRI